MTQPDSHPAHLHGKGILLLLAYLPPFAVVPLIAEKADPRSTGTRNTASC